VTGFAGEAAQFDGCLAGHGCVLAVLDDTGGGGKRLPGE
jgi:hypothetical protein